LAKVVGIVGGDQIEPGVGIMASWRCQDTPQQVVDLACRSINSVPRQCFREPNVIRGRHSPSRFAKA
jgi:hypothetical protein